MMGLFFVQAPGQRERTYEQNYRANSLAVLQPIVTYMDTLVLAVLHAQNIGSSSENGINLEVKNSGTCRGILNFNQG